MPTLPMYSYAIDVEHAGSNSEEVSMRNVPMTRPEEALAIHDQAYGHSLTFVGLEGGRILLSSGRVFRYSDDGGITWSEEFQKNTPGAEIS